MKRVANLAAVVLLASCARAIPSTGAASSSWRVGRPAGQHLYRFTSSQDATTGRSQVAVTFRLESTADGTERAVVVGYERAGPDGVFAAAPLEPACADRLRQPDGAIAVLPITPAPTDLRLLLDPCAPEDFFGAATDILALLMIQVQPSFRAGELRRIGDTLSFPGYVVRWQRPPRTLDARITADSGRITLDSLGSNRGIITWDTSPMAVDLLVQLAPTSRALLHGTEWFTARLAFDPRTGSLLSAWTVADSLSLGMHAPYPADTVPLAGAVPGREVTRVRITRALRLESLPR